MVIGILLIWGGMDYAPKGCGFVRGPIRKAVALGLMWAIWRVK